VASPSSDVAAPDLLVLDRRDEGGREAWARTRAPKDMDEMSTLEGATSSSSDYCAALLVLELVIQVGRLHLHPLDQRHVRQKDPDLYEHRHVDYPPRKHRSLSRSPSR
jgi:hypothetical protein